jgi:hypothetical protein
VSRSTESDQQADADLLDGRRETRDERMDRNWNEILQELRVVQTGTQLLTGFLLAVAFQPRFDTLDRLQLVVYLALITTAALTTAIGLAPVTLHRSLFRRHLKAALVSAANLLLKIALAGVGLMLVGVILLIFDVTVGRTAAVIASGATLVVLVLIACSPLLFRHSGFDPADPPSSAETGQLRPRPAGEQRRS